MNKESELCCVCLEEVFLDLCRDLKCCKKNIHIKCLLELFLYNNKEYSLSKILNCPLCRQNIQIEFTIPDILVINYLYKDKFNKNLIKQYIMNNPLKYNLPKIYINEFINDNKPLISNKNYDYDDDYYYDLTIMEF